MDELRVLFDAHQLGRNQTGNETYVRELLREFRTREGLEITAVVEAGSEGSDAVASPIRPRRVPRSGLLRLAALSMLARPGRYDILHAIYFLPPALRIASVVTIHDISYEIHPEFFARRARLRDKALIRDAARRADRIVTVSETSRRDIVDIYGIAPERVVAIPNGVGPRFVPIDREPPEPGRLRLLAVGTLQPRKNLLRVIDAISALSSELEIDLRVIGPDGFQGAQIRERLSSKARVDIVGYVTDQQLADEYRRADVLVYPSVYEGFGLPVVESMASGTPVVTSTGGSLPEVAGDAAIVVDPYDTVAIVDALRAAGTDRNRWIELRARGLERARAFSWEMAASRLLSVYSELAEDL